MEKKPNKSMNLWINIFAVFCCGCFAAVILRLFWMQIIDYDFYLEKASDQQTKVLTVEAKRGAIYDTNGNLLKTTATVYSRLTHGSAVKGTTYNYRIMALHKNSAANSSKSVHATIKAK